VIIKKEQKKSVIMIMETKKKEKHRLGLEASSAACRDSLASRIRAVAMVGL